MIQPYEGGGIKFALSATGEDGKLHIMIMENMSLTTFIYKLFMPTFKTTQQIKEGRTH